MSKYEKIDTCEDEGNAVMYPDENTTEVPLLSDCKGHEQATMCPCQQSGFTSSRKDGSTKEAKLKLAIGIALCGAFMIIEFLGGYLAGSLAIMTDAAHLATDAISFAIGLAAIELGSRPPDGRMSFGYNRIQVMGALLSIFSTWVLTATLTALSVKRIFKGDYGLNANTMIVVSGIGVCINIVMALMLHGSSWLPETDNDSENADKGTCKPHLHGHWWMHHRITSHIGDDNANTEHGPLHPQCSQLKIRNLNLRAALVHVIGDLAQSIGVLIASIIIKIFPKAQIVDPMCTLLFTCIIMLTTVDLFKDSVAILMDAVPPSVSLSSLKSDLLRIEDRRSTPQCMEFGCGLQCSDGSSHRRCTCGQMRCTGKCLSVGQEVLRHQTLYNPNRMPDFAKPQHNRITSDYIALLLKYHRQKGMNAPSLSLIPGRKHFFQKAKVRRIFK